MVFFHASVINGVLFAAYLRRTCNTFTSSEALLTLMLRLDRLQYRDVLSTSNLHPVAAVTTSISISRQCRLLVEAISQAWWPVLVGSEHAMRSKPNMESEKINIGAIQASQTTTRMPERMVQYHADPQIRTTRKREESLTAMLFTSALSGRLSVSTLTITARITMASSINIPSSLSDRAQVVSQTASCDQSQTLSDCMRKHYTTATISFPCGPYPVCGLCQQWKYYHISISCCARTWRDFKLHIFHKRSYLGTVGRAH